MNLAMMNPKKSYKDKGVNPALLVEVAYVVSNCIPEPTIAQSRGMLVGSLNTSPWIFFQAASLSSSTSPPEHLKKIQPSHLGAYIKYMGS